jgi:hypothetical protein
MNSKLQAQPENILDENFDADLLFPADLAQVIEAAFQEYEAIPPFTKLRKKYRDAVNSLVDCLSEKRGYMQFNYLT